jgi:hypothetical protein
VAAFAACHSLISNNCPDFATDETPGLKLTNQKPAILKLAAVARFKAQATKTI